MTRDVVFTFWHETWESALQRQFMPSDRLSQALLRDERVGGLLIADPFRSTPTQLARRMMGRKPTPLPARPRTALVRPMRLRRFDGIGEATHRRTYEAYDKKLRKAAADLGLNAPAVITTNPLYAAYGPLDWAGPVTYYAWDDWTALPSQEAYWPDYLNAYAEIKARRQRVCAVSAPLLERIDPDGPSLLAPNGIEPEEWQPPWSKPAWLDGLRAPLIIYVGSIALRLNTDTVREIAERFPNGTVLVVGPVANEGVVATLRAISNVSVRDSLPRAEIAGLIRHADVCIMPHHRNTLTVSMSPLKIYEYVAAGRPTVVSDLPGVYGVDDSVIVVRDGESFPDAVAKALAKGPLSEAARQAFLERSSWARRHDSILDFALVQA